MTNDPAPCNGCEPGWCARFQKTMSPHLIHLCKTRADYRRIWDKALSNPPTPAGGATAKRPEGGPGTNLKKFFARLGFKATTHCKCTQHALEMDVQGPAWCRQNITTILGWLKEESDKQGLPFSETLAAWAVERAIAKAERQR